MPLSFKVVWLLEEETKGITIVPSAAGGQRASLLFLRLQLLPPLTSCMGQVPGGVYEDHGYVSCFHRFSAKKRGWVMAGGGEIEQRVSEDACIVSNIVNTL